MKQGLTKREKLMLLIAGLLLLMYFAFQFGFVPLYNSYQEAVIERDRLHSERLALELSILNLNSIIEANKAANNEFDEITKDYPLLIPNEEIDSLLTNLILSSGLSPRTLNIFTAPADADSILFTIINVSMSVEGSYVSLLRLLDEVAKIPNISISTMSFSERLFYRDDEDEEVRGYGTITLGFELMYITPVD